MASDLKIFGPYKRGDGWRCLLGNGRKRSPLPTRKTEAEALRFAELALRHLRAETPPTIPEVLESYQAHLELTNRPRAVTTAMFRLKSLLPDPSGSLRSLTPAKCQSRYMDLVKRQKPDTHRNALAVAKSFGRWLVEKEHVRVSPFEAIKPLGQRSRGKEQLTNDETKRWSDVALRDALGGSDGALAAYMTLVLGMRAGEVVVRTVRDVDDGGTRLRIRKAKTRKGDRDVKLPPVLQELISRRCVGRKPDALLFPTEDEDGDEVPHLVGWVRDNVRRICRLAGVPLVCAHSMRGKHADLSVSAGMSPDVVASSIGHESAVMTMRSYAKPETLHELQRNRAAERLGIADLKKTALRVVP